jgi:hypothetical protein
MMYLIYFAGPLLGAAAAVGVFKLLNTADTMEESEPIPDLDEVEEIDDIEEVGDDEAMEPKAR